MWSTPTYTDEFKQKIVQLAREGRSRLSLQQEYGVHRQTIDKWVRAAGQRADKPEIARRHTTPGGHTVLVIPDMHHPFCHPDALEFLKAVRSKYSPTKVVCLGDEIDAHAFSRYPMDPDGLTAGQELRQAIESLTPFYLEFPEMSVCESNHTIRPWKKAFESGLPAAFLPTVAKILNAPDGWIWKKKHVIDGVLYVHGDNGKSGQYAAVNYMKQAKQPVVIGHIHAFASVFYEGPHFAMNAGCLIEKETYPFKYASGALLDVSLGCGIVHNGKWATFVPMILDANSRWAGCL